MIHLNKKVQIDEETFEKAKNFAENSVGSSSDKYANRQQFNIDKIKQDIKVGRLGEEIAYQELSSIFPNLSKPDYSIYDASNKSWDSDLKEDVLKIKFAVKTQDIRSDLDFGTSWVFQYNHNRNYDCDKEIFQLHSSQTSYVCLVSLNSPKRFGTIRAVVKTSWLHENDLFKPMKLAKLVGNKLAVYYEDLEKFDNLCQIT